MKNFTGILLPAVLLLAPLWLNAQHCHTALSGHVYDAETGEPLAYAVIQLTETGSGTSSDANGYYVIPNLCEDSTYTVLISHIECEHLKQQVQAVENRFVDFRLKHTVLREVVISEKAVVQQPIQPASTVAQLDMEAGQAGGLGETLKRLPGVTLLSTGATIAKPVIHGLHSNRIAIISNNVALEGQQWGSEHAPEVDPFSAGQIRVVKGAAGLRYGPGALGGAVVLDPAPLRDSAGWGGRIITTANSNGYGGAFSGMADVRRGRLGLRFQATAKRNGNLRTPDYWLNNTGTAELDGSFMADWRGARWKHEFSFSSFQQRIGILRAAHIGNLTDLNRAIASNRPFQVADSFSYAINRPYQQILHTTGKYKGVLDLNDTWQFTAQLASQFNHRREYDAHPPLSDPDDSEKRAQLRFRIWTNTLDAALEHRPVRHWQGGVGVQGLEQQNLVDRGGLIPNFRTFGGSAWVIERWRRYPFPLELELGARYDYRYTRVTNSETYRQIDTVLHFGNISATAGVLYRLSPYASLSLNAATAWRPPHVNELFARGVHHGAATYEQGRSDLVPEQAWNGNLDFKYNRAGTDITISAYYNRIQHYIYLNPQLEPVLTVRGAFPAYYYEQADAVLRGLDASLTLPFGRRWAAEGRASILRAQRLLENSEGGRDWLPLMPSDRFQYGLKWSTNNRTEAGNFIRLTATTALRQTRIPAAGLVKAAPSEFTVFNLDAGYALTWFSKPVSMGLSVQNLFNRRYREYLNFFRLFADEPGVNVSFRIKMEF